MRPFASRVYDPSHDTSALWRWYEIRQGDGVGSYLLRLVILRTKRLGGVMLHRIFKPDADRDLHDHPWPFVSIVLLGSYVERVRGPLGELRDRRVRWLNVKRAEDAHKILEVSPLCTTLVLHGPRCRRWGFHSPVGWIYWRTYLGLE